MPTRRLLMAAGGDGAFVVPTCVSTAPDGSPLSIAGGGGTHYGFPTICRLPNENLMLGYRKGADHAAALDGQGITRVSADDGVTWGSEVVAFDPPGLSASDSGLSVSPANTVLLSTTTEDGDTLAANYFGYVLRSTNNGTSWGSPIAFGSSFGTGGSHREVGGSLIVTLQDGRLMAPIAGRTSGQADTNESVVVMFSSDDGLTWEDETTVLSVSGHFYTEPVCVRLPGDTLHMLIRRNDTGNIYRTIGTPDGSSWSTATIAFSGRGKPSHALFDCGLMLYVSRPNPTGDTIYRTSTDYGASWSSETTLDTYNTNNSYAGLVRQSGTRLLCVYGAELVDGSESDIRSQVFTASF